MKCVRCKHLPWHGIVTFLISVQHWMLLCPRNTCQNFRKTLWASELPRRTQNHLNNFSSTLVNQASPWKCLKESQIYKKCRQLAVCSLASSRRVMLATQSMETSSLAAPENLTWKSKWKLGTATTGAGRKMPQLHLCGAQGLGAEVTRKYKSPMMKQGLHKPVIKHVIWEFAKLSKLPLCAPEIPG